ncbi:pyridoxal 5'-phosphate synthase glutaminase subunit PdxT [Halococcus salsus]|uniref:pyridoxal 5'-phosphate synthase glutaminase subunit PdxT n=1 Tax=Halococcus salsus TaxID=2162894 RepID=UPI00135A7E55|nr:pyridoxal 5'-phosphate synthase glutaminase subunit PdxT [Halococcus salsus]
MSLTAGVIAVQGDFREHASAIEHAARAHDERAEPIEVRTSGTVPDCDLLLLPGGESTAISAHLQREGLAAEIREHVAAGKPLLATCAGLIVACTDAGDDRVDCLDLVDATVARNAFGRQRDSFETRLDVEGLDEPFPAVFIRAPQVASVGECEVLATFDGHPVAVRDGPVIGTAVHPELTDDARIHGLAFFESPE